MHVPNECFSPSWMCLTCGPLLSSCIPIFSLPIAQLLVYSNRSQSSSLSAFFSVSGAGQFPHPAIYSLGLLDDLL